MLRLFDASPQFSIHQRTNTPDEEKEGEREIQRGTVASPNLGFKNFTYLHSLLLLVYIYVCVFFVLFRLFIPFIKEAAESLATPRSVRSPKNFNGTSEHSIAIHLQLGPFIIIIIIIMIVIIFIQ